MSEWTRTRIGDVVTLQRGFDITRSVQEPGDIPVVSSGGIGSYHSESAARGPGVVIGRKGTLGKVFYLDSDYWPHDTTLWVKDFKGSSPRFVYYFLQTLNLAHFDVGSSNPTLNRNHVHPIVVNWPPRSEQDSIASILGALDDKIVINEKMAATASEVAKSIFAREHIGSTCPLDDICELRKRPVSPKNIADVIVAHYSLPAFDAGCRAQLCVPDEIKSAKFRIDEPVVLLSKLNPTIPRIWLVDPTNGPLALASTEFLVLAPKAGISLVDLWATLSQVDLMATLAARATGTSNSHQRVKPVDALAAEVMDPRSIHPDVRRSAQELHERVEHARAENVTLAELRDALLPKLISGELRVRDAERQVSDVV